MNPTYLVIHAVQCSHVAVLDSNLPAAVPRWQTGNIYADPDAPGIRIPLHYHNKAVFRGVVHPSNSMVDEIVLFPGETKTLDVMVGLDYEIRLFGDPLASSNSSLPIIQAELHVSLEFGDPFYVPFGYIGPVDKNGDIAAGLALSLSENTEPPIVCLIVRDPLKQIVPDFVDGWAYGEMVGVEVTSCSTISWTLNRATATVVGDSYPFDVSKKLVTNLAASILAVYVPCLIAHNFRRI
jgi:hypothetical protein